MGCGTSANAIAPLHYNHNGSALWVNTAESVILEYMTSDEIKEADDRALQICESQNSVERLADNLSKNAKNSIICTRSFFKWITSNIRHDPENDSNDINSILKTKKCSSEGYANLFEQMCRHKNIQVITVKSFVKSYSFSLDYEHFDGIFHMWNAVFVDNKYLYIDCAWAALPVNGQKKLSDSAIEDPDHFFLTSPDIVGDLC